MPTAIPKKLIVLGDSGVYGWGDPEEGGWCERLRRHWMGLPGGPVLYPLGVRGDGLERVAARLDREVSCRGELRRQQPHGILLAVGLNDTARVGRADGRPQLDAEGFLFGLQQILDRARLMAPVLMVGLTPVLEEPMPYAEVLWYSLEQVRRYEGLLEEACLEADVPFLPLLDALLEDPCWPQWLSSDGVHLNSEGHRQVYQRVQRWPALLRWAELEPLVRATPLN
ncbi:arylesterase [Synechococcus sp. HJ21-Hayes]|jgi:lysophospholipase L1-like esterase|uniref:GDSL-type esterase/lipase family protein n=1 Tax=Synechococcus sp. HJ21-Hayes TaxID=2823736 RepID=UPI0020CE90A4|nr:GDSL-type esterase/lipase family protein [Synechococcus sp. HJ21-Hayes]MCP9852579.1 arylesterase [Synechococcus sp. HJ21-Hayes]